MSELLQNEIRATKPTAPDALRDRIRELAAQEPARAPFFSRRPVLQWRRLVLVVPAAAVIALGSATVIGLTRDDDPLVLAPYAAQKSAGGDADESAATKTLGTYMQGGATAQSEDAAKRAAAPSVANDAAVVPPVTGQLQRYEAELRLRVEDVDALSDATKSAQQIALRHGGSVASLQYDAPAEGIGAAQITLRVPTARVQSAMSQLSQLGTIVGQRYGIEDLQQQADTLQTQIEQTQRRIAQILTQLESATISDETRAVLQSRLTASRQKLTGLRQSLTSTNVEARTATIYLSLTTEEIEATPVAGSRFDDIKDVLALEAVVLLYALVVLGPFVLLGVLVWLALRLRRRQVETRLLEQN